MPGDASHAVLCGKAYPLTNQCDPANDGAIMFYNDNNDQHSDSDSLSLVELRDGRFSQHPSAPSLQGIQRPRMKTFLYPTPLFGCEAPHEEVKGSLVVQLTTVGGPLEVDTVNPQYRL